MSKIVIFNGSPRMDGNTSTILQMIERGAKEHNAQVETYTLFKMKFMACQGCFGCRLQDDCMVNDELRKALQKVKEADAVVIGSPVYFMQVTGPVKNLYDRLFPLIGENGEPRFGKKKIVTVYTQDFDDPHAFDTYFDYLAQGMFPGFGFVDEDRIVCVNANNPETAENNRELKQNAYDVGRMLANLSK
ncbi:MAG TPA: flavodoxin family protein [Candidatus Eubacterium avistercoris]|uniref:Flavodoxin family protein n=1 Tax=Candidatus Eubacterium avistercoris TaxID=2838567 RepID=A0A9D2D0Q4_9FIRM|nr:flavodoxin family protein [Candidatus Eubacterium avistercoris]